VSLIAGDRLSRWPCEADFQVNPLNLQRQSPPASHLQDTANVFFESIEHFSATPRMAGVGTLTKRPTQFGVQPTFKNDFSERAQIRQTRTLFCRNRDRNSGVICDLVFFQMPSNSEIPALIVDVTNLAAFSMRRRVRR
jgi:hypothetical protein